MLQPPIDIHRPAHHPSSADAAARAGARLPGDPVQVHVPPAAGQPDSRPAPACLFCRYRKPRREGGERADA